MGYPDRWESYKQLPIDRESYTKNIMEATKFHFFVEMKRLAKPTDPSEWLMSAATVNAYNQPNLNQITFPAGILQPPFFYPDGDVDHAINYGAIGAVIAHELTHSFDDSGAKFDKHGNLKNWWTKSDESKFKKEAKKLVTQFNSFEVSDGVKVNGKLTLGENIADLGGVLTGFDALQIALSRDTEHNRVIGGLTPEQRFFVSCSIAERTLARPEFQKFAARTDPHSPNEFRINGPFVHVDAFYAAFNVGPGDVLYREPKNRCRIW